MIRVLVALSVVALSFAGCGDSSSSGDGGGDGDGTGGGGGGSSSQEVTTCKQACQKQKFFDCYDAEQHAACFDKCEQASSSQIETFAGCVGTDTCDAECSLNVDTSGTSDGDSSGGSSGGDGGDSVSECVSACDALVSDGCIPDADCEAACEESTESDRKALLYCESARDGCDFPEECTDATGGGSGQCEFACQNLGQQGCISSSDVSDCTSRCDEISDEEAESFVSCVNSGFCEDDSCYQQISEGGASADVTGCKTTCDDMSSSDCLSSEQHSECRTLCEDASKEDIETFKSCDDPTTFCDDDSCYQTFQSNVGG